MKRWMLCMGLLLVALAPAPPGLAGIPQVPQDTLAERVKACTACHGEQGRAGLDGCYPRLVGKPTGYLYQQSLILAQG
ncbi:MAG: c-type cytochrome, partial [Limnohabitans sp.]